MLTEDVIIRKQTIKIITSNEKLAFECRQFANESLSDDLVKMYEHLFYQGTPSKQYVIIDSIKVDLGTLSTHDFKHHFFDLLEDKLINELRNQFETVSEGRELGETAGNEQETEKKPDPITYRTEDQQYREALFIFLQSGSFPWWYQKKNKKMPAEVLKDFSSNEKTNLLVSLITKARHFQPEMVKQIVKRLYIHLHQTAYETYLIDLANLFSEDYIKSNIRILIKKKDSLTSLFQISSKEFYEQAVIFILLAKDHTDFIRKFLVHLKQTFPVSAVELKKRFAALPIQNLVAEQESLFNFDKDLNLKKTDEPITLFTKKRSNFPELNEGIYIFNVGLVILHPFLSPFFKSLNLLNDNNQFISVETQSKAAVVLYYLQSGQVDYKEWEMPLNKILCGMATDELIPDDILLSDQDKEESCLLLQSVIKYWEALKGASVEALQTTFFVREGKITFKETHWLIQVERTGVDILLDRLPWGIGTIKLPWLKEIIYIEW